MSSNTPASSSSTTTTTTTTSNGNASKKQAKPADKDSKILVQFVTKNPDIKVPETPIAVPAKLGRYGLSEVINLLLNNEKPKPFDFLIETEFIRTSIDKHIRKHNLKEELVVIEYTEAVVPPEKELECEHDDWVSCLQGGFSGFVVTGSYDKKLRIWDQQTGECLSTVPAHESAVKSVAWIAKTTKRSKKGNNKLVYKVASAGLDRLIKTWRISESGATLRHVYKGHFGSVNSVYISPNGKQMCSGSFDHTIKVWNLKSYEYKEAKLDIAKRRKLDSAPLEIIDAITMTGHTASVACVQWPTATQLVSASWDHTIKVWDVEEVTTQQTLIATTVANWVSYSTLHALVASSHADTSIRVWDPRSDDNKHSQFTLNSHTSWGSGVAWHPYSPHAQLASSSHDGTVKVWDLRSSLPLFTLSHHKDKVLCVDWAGLRVGEKGEEGKGSEIGNVSRFDIASGGADNKLRVFKCDSLQQA